MKNALIFLIFLSVNTFTFSQNQNISQGNIFDGEPYIAINPTNSQHMVVAWMGYQPLTRIFIKTKVSFDAGQTWSAMNTLPHVKSAYGSADPSMAFDNNGNLFLAYIDFSTAIDSGEVYVVKSADGGLNWAAPVKVIDAYDDLGQYPVDRPWMSVDNSGGTYDGNIYVTSMPPSVFGLLATPNRSYFVKSTDAGSSFNPYRYLDTVNWMSGDAIRQPMPTNCVAADGSFHAVYPSYEPLQSPFSQYIIASSDDAGNSFTHNSVLLSSTAVGEPLAKKGYLLRANPANANHLAFFYIAKTHGDLDVFMRESFDNGVTWGGEIRINDDPIGNDRMQDVVWADFDTDGDLVVSWRDRRNGGGASFQTDSEIWGTIRHKDSANFVTNFPITDNLITYDAVLENNGNDFMCIKLMNDTLNTVWGDPRNGKLNIWFSRIGMDGNLLSSQQIAEDVLPIINIYPNPASSIIFVDGKEIEEVTIFDQAGKLMEKTSKLKGVESLELNIENFPNGVYFVQVISRLGIISKKIIKE